MRKWQTFWMSTLRCNFHPTPLPPCNGTVPQAMPGVYPKSITVNSSRRNANQENKLKPVCTETNTNTIDWFYMQITGTTFDLPSAQRAMCMESHPFMPNKVLNF